MTNHLEFHPVANVFPMMSADEFTELVSDITQNGLMEPIWRDKNGLIIDGRNRYLACSEAGIDPTFRTWDGTGSLIEFVVSLNLKRRHLTASQKACVAVEIEQSLAIEAKERQRLAGVTHGRGKVSQKIEQPISSNCNKSSEQAAKITGSNRQYVSEAKKLKSTSPDTYQAVASGKLTLPQAKQIVLKNDNPDVSDKKFNYTTDSVDWAKWSWNPVTGCRHGCKYCYARDIANHFPKTFPKGFDYDVHWDRFNAPNTTKISESKIDEPGIHNVFVCSMADLFGDWVETSVIQEILSVCEASPQWKYIFLTKNPKRLLDFKFPNNSLVGTTVDVKARVGTALEVMPQVNAPVKFISVEPMLEDLEIDDLTGIDWVIIGSQTTGSNVTFHPEWEWVKKLHETAISQNVPVYWKPNLYKKFKQFPEGI